MGSYPDKKTPVQVRTEVLPTPVSSAPKRAVNIRVIAPEWIPQVETTLTADLLKIQQGLVSNCTVVILYDPKEVRPTPSFLRVLDLLGVAVQTQPVNPDAEQGTTTLVYYTKRANKPPSLCNRKNLFYRYVGLEPSASPMRFDMTPQAPVTFPETTRPLPGNQSLTTFPAPTSLNLRSRLPWGWDQGPLMG